MFPRFSLLKFVLSLGLSIASLSAPVLAQDVPAPPPEIAELVDTCKACHGDNGVPVQEDAPIIWGQEQYYMYVQMRDIKAGRRESEIMGPIVQDLDKDTMKALAEYFSQLKWPSLGYSTPEADIPIAEAAAVAGQCPQCHLGAWVGNSRVPRLAGQNVHYLEKTMLDLKYDRRKNAPDVGALFKDMSDDDVRSLARYAAGK
jgi:cytochrome c553